MCVCVHACACVRACVCVCVCDYTPLFPKRSNAQDSAGFSSEVKQLLHKMDEDKNGYVSFEEFTHYLAAISLIDSSPETPPSLPSSSPLPSLPPPTPPPVQT